nr:hypothetical protein [Tanacetum cinerariifolium]
ILVGYSTQSKGYRGYNKRTRMIVESIYIRFEEIQEVSETSVANDTSSLKKITYQMMNLPMLSVHRHKKLLSLPHTTLKSTCSNSGAQLPRLRSLHSMSLIWILTTSSEETGTKPGVLDEEKVTSEAKADVILDWGSEEEMNTLKKKMLMKRLIGCDEYEQENVDEEMKDAEVDDTRKDNG